MKSLNTKALDIAFNSNLTLNIGFKIWFSKASNYATLRRDVGIDAIDRV